MRLSLLFVLLASASCQSAPSELADAAAAVDAAPDLVNSAHPALPILTNQGGQVISALEQWVVVWQGDEARGQTANTFFQWLLTSDFWTGALGQYGVGMGVAKGVIVIPSPPPATIEITTDDAALINQVLAAGSVTPDASTAFAILVPSQTMLTRFGSPVGCSLETSYHADVNNVPYEMIMNCPPRTLTHELTHETSEVATDPFADVPGWLDPDFAQFPEVADMCAQLADVMIDGHAVPRLYSNAAAALGTQDPCVPAPTDVPYFGVASDPTPVPIPIDANGNRQTTISFTAFSYDAVGPLSWSTSIISGLTFTPAQGSLAPGTSANVTLAANKNIRTGDVFSIHSSDSQGKSNVWTAAVTLP